MSTQSWQCHEIVPDWPSKVLITTQTGCRPSTTVLTSVKSGYPGYTASASILRERERRCLHGPCRFGRLTRLGKPRHGIADGRNRIPGENNVDCVYHGSLQPIDRLRLSFQPALLRNLNRSSDVSLGIKAEPASAFVSSREGGMCIWIYV